MSKILLVEDDELLSRIYARAFVHEGFEVEIAVNGQMGFQKVSAFNPDVILTDVMMPVMNGLELLKKLKSDPKTSDIPVIMLTNLDEMQLAIDATKNGAVQYIVKLDHIPTEVVALVKALLAKIEKGSPPPTASTQS